MLTRTVNLFNKNKNGIYFIEMMAKFVFDVVKNIFTFLSIFVCLFVSKAKSTNQFMK